MAGFTYKKNSFYIETGDEILSDPITFSGYLHGNSFSTKEEFEKAINLDHEINHYVQELFVNACITEGFFRDYLASYARELSVIKSVRFPLADAENAKFNKSLDVSEEDKETIKTFYEIFEVFDYIYNQAHSKPHNEEYYYSEIAEPLFDHYSLKYIHLLEFYAYHKAYWDFFIRNESGEGADLLHQLTIENHVYPVKWRNNRFEIENAKRYIDWNERYQLVNLMMIVGIPFGVSSKEYLDYCENKIPHNYRNSPSLFANSAHRIILETALNIPSIGYIMSTVTKGKYSKEVFSPVHRFYKIMKNVRDFGGYPDAIPGEDFFITFFDWCAKQNGWPTYQETYESIISMLYQRASQGHESITNFQLSAVYGKNTRYGRYAQDLPFTTLSINNLPLLLRSEHRFVIQQTFNNNVIDMSFTDFYQVMFGTEEVKKYKALTPEMDFHEAYETVFNNGQAAIREILYRLFSGAAFNAYIYKGKFSCPLHKMGCPCSVEKCGSFVHFDDVFGRCEKKILRFGPIKSYQPDGGGNIPDCMFFNYLIDYKYNIKTIEDGTDK